MLLFAGRNFLNSNEWITETKICFYYNKVMPDCATQIADRKPGKNQVKSQIASSA
jgi:hypothetical protein